MKSYYIVCALVASFRNASSATASSARPKPLKRIAHPSTVALDVIPRKSPPSSRSKRSAVTENSPGLRHTDALRLTLRAFDDTFHLHLRPNEYLIHPSARINYYSPEGEITHSEPLLASDYKIYEGTLVHPNWTDERLKEDLAGGVYDPGRTDLGWARIMVHDEGNLDAGVPPSYEGTFSANGIIHHVQLKDNYNRNKHELDPEVDDDDRLVVFRDIDMGDESISSRCSHDKLEYNTDKTLNPVLAYGAKLRNPRMPWYDPRSSGFSSADPIDLDARFVKRQGNDISGGNVTSNFISNIGSHEGCKPTQSFIYMGVAADCTYVSHYGSNANATSQILNDWNSASSLYKSTFNVSLGIVELAVQDPTCPSSAPASTPWNTACSSSTTLNDRLSIFSQWRGSKGAADGAGLWHLMSGCPTGTEVGVAWLGQLCNVQTSGSAGEFVSGTGVSTATLTEWQVVAHEIGHNFGAIHDCAAGCSLSDPCCPATATQCSSSQVFVMDAVSNVGENVFSQCSVGNICISMETMNTTCLLSADQHVQTISKQMCGNGIVETGEDCDPGKGNTSPCCDSTTCKFTNNAQCDPKSSDCCTNSCQFAPSTQVCRPSVDAKCDIAEMCTGSSADCPADKTTPDGTSCGSGGLACASGQCTSPDVQCKTVGASMNLNQACPAANDKSCQVSCKDPSNSQQCIVLQATLVDGSPCGFGGKCVGNVCKAGSLEDTIKAWYTQNLQISIPVTIAAGILLLLVLWRIVSACCCRRRAQKSAAYNKSVAGRQRLGSWPPQNQQGIPMGPPPDYQQQAMRNAPATSRSGYVSPGEAYAPQPPQEEHHYPPQDEPFYPPRGETFHPPPQDHAFSDRTQVVSSLSLPNPFDSPEEQYEMARPRSPPRQQGWVDDSAYNGRTYSRR